MPTPIQSPSGYAATRAVAFADVDGNALLVSNAAPLPVIQGAVPATPLAGSAAASTVIGPYQPALDRPAMLTLSGTWAGTVRLLRSTDGGTTKLPVTVAGDTWALFTANCCEPVWDESEASAQLYLDIALTSGTLTYRIAQ
jgi:hypothetical protein